uniref:SAP domain-containing protein n=1 Tax=Strongyloides papillosus TaxID=174720 RepID=A0A0N5BH37_STREA
MEVISTEIKDVNINGSKNNLSNDSISTGNSNEYGVLTPPNIMSRQKSSQNCQMTTTVATTSTSPYSQYQPSSAFVNAKLAAGSSEVIHVSKSISTSFCENQQQYIHNQNPKRITTSNNLVATNINSPYYQPSGGITSNSQSLGENDINTFQLTDSIDNSIKNNSYMPITRHYLTNQKSNLSKNINNTCQVQNNTCYQNNYKTIEKSPNFEYTYCDNSIKNVETSPLPHSSTPLSSISYSSSTENAPVASMNETEVTIKSKLSFMKVSELKSECKKRNISSNGSKTQLLERLQPYEDSILLLNKEENDQDNVKSMPSINIGNQQHSINQVSNTTEYYVTGPSNEYITKQYDSQNTCHSTNFSSHINHNSKRMSSHSGNVSSFNSIDGSDGMSGIVIRNNQLQEGHLDMKILNNETIKEEYIDNGNSNNESYYVEVPTFKVSNSQSPQQYVKLVNQTGTVVGISQLSKNTPTNIATSSNLYKYHNTTVGSGSSQNNGMIYYNQISQQGKQNNQDSNLINSQSGKYSYKTISNNVIKSSNSTLNHQTLTRVSSDSEIYQQNTLSQMYTTSSNNQENYIFTNTITPNYQSDNNILHNSPFSNSNDNLPLNTTTTILRNSPTKQPILNIKGNDNTNNKAQNSVSFVVLQQEPRQRSTVSRNLDSYRVMPNPQNSNSLSSYISNGERDERNNYTNQTYPVQENQKDLQKTIDHTDTTHYHMGVKHAALSSSIINNNINDTLKNFVFKSFPVGDINKSFQEISSEVKKIFSQNGKNCMEKNEPIMTAEIMHVHEDMIQQQFTTINNLYNKLLNSQYQLKNYQNILIAANNFDVESIQRREKIYPTLSCLKELDTRSINRKYMKLYSNYENIYHNLKDGVKEHQTIVDNEEVLQDLAHVTQATEDIVRLIKQDSRTALLIVQLLRNFQVERSQCASRRNSFNVLLCEESDSKNLNEQRKDQRHLETGFFKGQPNCNQNDLFTRSDNQINGIDRSYQSNIKETKSGKDKIGVNTKNTSIYSNVDNTNSTMSGSQKNSNNKKNGRVINKAEPKTPNKAVSRRRAPKNTNKAKDEEKIVNDMSKAKKSTSSGKINDMEEIFKTVIKESSKCVTAIESKERAEETINEYVKNPPNSSPSTNNNINGINYTTTVMTNSSSVQSQIQQSNNNGTQVILINKDPQYGTQQQRNGGKKRVNTQSIQKQNNIQQKSPKVQQCAASLVDTIPQHIQIQHSSPILHQHLQPNSVEAMDNVSSQQYHYQTYQNDQNNHFSPVNVTTNCINGQFIQQQDHNQQYNNILNNNQISSTTFYAIPTNTITMTNQSTITNQGNGGNIVYHISDGHHQSQPQYSIINNTIDDNTNYTFATTTLQSSDNFSSSQIDQNGMIHDNTSTHWITSTQPTSHHQQNICNTSMDNTGTLDISTDSGIQHNISSVDINSSKSGDEINVLLDDSWYNNNQHRMYDSIQNNSQHSTNNNNRKSQTPSNTTTTSSSSSSTIIPTTTSSLDGSNIRNTIYSNSQSNNNMLGYNPNFSDSDSFNFDNNDINQQGDQNMDWVDQQLMT